MARVVDRAGRRHGPVPGASEPDAARVGPPSSCSCWRPSTAARRPCGGGSARASARPRTASPPSPLAVDVEVTAGDIQGRARLLLPPAAVTALAGPPRSEEPLLSFPLFASLRGGSAPLLPEELVALAPGDVVLVDPPPRGRHRLLFPGGFTALGPVADGAMTVEGTSMDERLAEIPVTAGGGAGAASPLTLADLARLAPGATLPLPSTGADWYAAAGRAGAWRAASWSTWTAPSASASSRWRWRRERPRPRAGARGSRAPASGSACRRRSRLAGWPLRRAGSRSGALAGAGAGRPGGARRWSPSLAAPARRGRPRPILRVAARAGLSRDASRGGASRSMAGGCSWASRPAGVKLVRELARAREVAVTGAGPGGRPAGRAPSGRAPGRPAGRVPAPPRRGGPAAPCSWSRSPPS